MTMFIVVVSAMLALIATMLAVTMLIAWRDFGRPPHALSWASAFALSAIHWCTSLMVLLIGRPVHSREAALAPFLIVISGLLYLGFRQRAGRSGEARRIALLCTGALAAVGMLWASPLTHWTDMAAYVVSAAFLLSAAAVMTPRRQRRTVAERAAIAALLVVAMGQIVMGPIILSGRSADTGEMLVRAIGVLLPTGFTALGLSTVFLIAADLSTRMQRLAQTDPLTGLLNRRGLDEAVVQRVEWGRRRSAGGAAVMADLDSFKHLNDRFGHDAGDAALRAFAALLRAALRPGEAAARTGGEEFALLLPGQTIAEAAARIEALRVATEAIRLPGRPDVRISASFGLAAIDTVRQPGRRALAAAIERADTALIAAKGGGRNRIVLADAIGASPPEYA